MIRLCAAVWLLLMMPSTIWAAPQGSVSFQLDSVPVSQVIRVMYSEVLKTPYVIDPTAQQDERLVSFRWNSGSGDVRAFISRFLAAMGYQVATVGGVDFVGRAPGSEANEPEKQLFIYRPKYRDGSYLADTLQPAFKGTFTIKRTVQASPGDKSTTGNSPPGSAASTIDRGNTDTLVFFGTAAEVQYLKTVLPEVDTPVGDVLVRGMIYEVQTSTKEGSAFQLAAGILGGKLNVSYGGKTTQENFIQFKFADVNAVFSALSGDSRFKVISAPSVRVRSGSAARFVVGQDVPVLGALSFPQGGGQAVQSIEYRNSGVIFSLTPQVRDEAIELEVAQQVSNFVKTETGVNDSPTLTKRELSTVISATDGDVLVLGGLTEDKDTATSSGLPFLPSFLDSTSSDNTKSELLLVLQVRKQ